MPRQSAALFSIVSPAMGQRQGPNGLSPPGPCGSRKYLSKSALYRVQGTCHFVAGMTLFWRVAPRSGPAGEALSPFDGVWKGKHLVLPEPNTCRCGRSVRHCTGCAGKSIPSSQRREEAACSPQPGAPTSDVPPSSGAALRFCLSKTVSGADGGELPNSAYPACREKHPFQPAQGGAACSPRPGAPASDSLPSSGAAKRFCLCKTAHIVRRALLPNSNKGAVRLYCWGPATGCSPMGMTLI